MLGGDRQTEDTCTVLIAANISLLIRAKLNYNSFHSHRDNQQTEFTISKTGALYHEKSWQQRIKYKYRVSQQYQTHCILPALSQLTTGLREHSHRKLLSAYLKTLKYFTTELRHWSRVTCVFINIFLKIIWVELTWGLDQTWCCWWTLDNSGWTDFLSGPGSSAWGRRRWGWRGCCRACCGPGWSRSGLVEHRHSLLPIWTK